MSEISESRNKLTEAQVLFTQAPLDEVSTPVYSQFPMGLAKVLEGSAKSIKALMAEFNTAMDYANFIDPKIRDGQNLLLEVMGDENQELLRDALNSSRVMAREAAPAVEQLDPMKTKLGSALLYLDGALKSLKEYEELRKSTEDHLNIASEARFVAVESIHDALGNI